MDVSEPASPKVISKFYPHQGSIFDIAKKNNYIYASNHAGLFFWRLVFDKFLIVDVSNSFSPTQMSSFITWTHVPRGLAVKDAFVYAAFNGDPLGMLTTIYVDNPQSPLRIGGTQSKSPENVVVDGDLIFVTSYNGLEVYRSPPQKILP